MNEETFANAGLAVGWLGTVIGALVVLVGLTITGKTAYELSQMEQTHGTAIEYQRGIEGMSGSWPHVSYIVDGREYVTSAHVYHDEGFRSGVREGDKVLIHYWKDAPAIAKVGLFHELWFVPILVTSVGIVALAIATILRLTQRRQENSSEIG
ncbi:MAG: DUF3592 domain-containing protein [Rhodopirellula sp. JB055]|uniref:DUF3592 domain-containing protein n=1 Tax=Rhodopirellula sp. JB055 TaxID=3342846 RepID=UPI00370AF915